MKKLILLITISFSAIGLFAQNKSDLSLIAQSLDQGKMNKKDCVMMKNGHLLMMKDGKTMDMPTDIVLENGMSISKNGTVTNADGTTRVMKNGDCVDMNGNWERIDLGDNKSKNK